MDQEREITASAFFYQKVKKYWTKFDFIVFLCAFAMTIIVHMYMFTHKFINHDDVMCLYSDCAFGLSSGRWLLQTVTELTGNFSSSWLNGLISALFLAVAVVLVVRLFRIRHYLPAVLLSFCMVSFPVLASTYSYMFCAPQYLFALTFSVIGVYCIRKEKIYTMIVGAVAIALSMGCYQSYFCLSAVLLVTLLGMDLLENRFGTDWKAFLLTGIKYVLSLAAGIILYFVVLKACLYVTGTELVSYHGMSSMGQLTMQELVNRICAAYRGFVSFCANQNKVFRSGFHVIIFADICLVLGVIIWRVVTKKLYKHPIMLLFLIALIVIFPLASGLMYIMAEEAYVHFVMMYPMIVVLLLPAVLMERIKLQLGAKERRASMIFRCKAVVFALLFVIQLVIGYEGLLITNRAYFYMDMTYENAYSYFVKLTTKIEMQEEYTADTPIALIGYANMDTYVPHTNMTGVITGNEALNYYSLHHFFNYFLGEYYVFATEKEKAGLIETETFKQMPRYPADGSIAMIDGTIVVKLSEIATD